jgi:hypothetical protein
MGSAPAVAAAAFTAVACCAMAFLSTTLVISSFSHEYRSSWRGS